MPGGGARGQARWRRLGAEGGQQHQHTPAGCRCAPATHSWLPCAAFSCPLPPTHPPYTLRSPATTPAPGFCGAAPPAPASPDGTPPAQRLHGSTGQQRQGREGGRHPRNVGTRVSGRQGEVSRSRGWRTREGRDALPSRHSHACTKRPGGRRQRWPRPHPRAPLPGCASPPPRPRHASGPAASWQRARGGGGGGGGLQLKVSVLRATA